MTPVCLVFFPSSPQLSQQFIYLVYEGYLRYLDKKKDTRARKKPKEMERNESSSRRTYKPVSRNCHTSGEA